MPQLSFTACADCARCIEGGRAIPVQVAKPGHGERPAFPPMLGCPHVVRDERAKDPRQEDAFGPINAPLLGLIQGGKP